MQSSRNIADGLKGNNYVLVEFRLLSASRNHLTTFCRLSVYYTCL